MIGKSAAILQNRIGKSADLAEKQFIFQSQVASLTGKKKTILFENMNTKMPTKYRKCFGVCTNPFARGDGANAELRNLFCVPRSF